MSDYDDFKNESKHNEMMLAIEGYVLDEVEKAVAAERARCAEIVKRHLAPMTHDRAAILYDIEDGGSDEQAHDDQ